MPRDIFDRVAAAKGRRITISLDANLDDGQPDQIRLKPMRMGDFMVLGGTIPMPTGRKWDEWSPDEKRDYWSFLKTILPYCVKERRHVETIEEPGKPVRFESKFIPFKVVASGQPANAEAGEMCVDDMEEVGDAIARAGNAVLYDTDVGGEMDTLPEALKDPNFRLGSGDDGNARLDGGDVLDPAPRDPVRQEEPTGARDPNGAPAV